jgi:uncharacterized protein (DUF427 family)
MSLLERSDRFTHCPCKGDASYHDSVADGARMVNVVWTHESPHPLVVAIKDFLLSLERVDSISESRE